MSPIPRPSPSLVSVATTTDPSDAAVTTAGTALATLAMNGICTVVEVVSKLTFTFWLSAPSSYKTVASFAVKRLVGAKDFHDTVPSAPVM
jgi:hypothetical protein